MAVSASRLQEGGGSADCSDVDIKRLHEAIKELRDELDRVDLAIQRIEVIAAAVVREQPADSDSSAPEPHMAEPAGEAD